MQVHLMSSEWIEALCERGFHVVGGSMGDNITTRGVDLINLPENTIFKYKNFTLMKITLINLTFRFQRGPVIKVTGLRDPCNLLNKFEAGLAKANLEKTKVQLSK